MESEQVAPLSPILPAVSIRETASALEAVPRGGSPGQVASTSSPYLVAPEMQTAAGRGGGGPG